MKYNKKTFTIAICITVMLTTIIVLGILYGLQWLPKGTSFSLDTMGVFLGAIGSVGAIIIIWLSTKKQLAAQMEIQKQNIKLGLFEKRIKIYTHIKDLLNNILNESFKKQKDPTWLNEAIIEYSQDLEQAQWLFDDDIFIFYQGIIDKINILNEASDKDNAENRKIIKWFMEQLREIDKTFIKYINVRKLGL